MPTNSSAGIDSTLLAQVRLFADGFRHVFPRADQHQHFIAYLAGLLTPGGRNNAEGIADRVAGVPMTGSDPRQALQHFLTRSPWDAERLMGECRRHLAIHPYGTPSVWVIQDAVFPKRGRHSVGVYRQFARDRGSKVNCQIGVLLGVIGPAGYTPQAARLYLPGGWLRDNPSLTERSVPPEHRRPSTKGEVALALLDEALADGWHGPRYIVAEAGYESSPGWDEAIQQRGLSRPPDVTHWLAAAATAFDTLRTEFGLDHFEGRTWTGWHHHFALVIAAFTFRAVAGDRSWQEPARAF